MSRAPVAVADEGQVADRAAGLACLRVGDVPHRHPVGPVAEGIVVRHRCDAPDGAGVEHALQALHDLRRIETDPLGDRVTGPRDQRQPFLGGGDDGAVHRVEPAGCEPPYGAPAARRGGRVGAHRPGCSGAPSPPARGPIRMRSSPGIGTSEIGCPTPGGVVSRAHAPRLLRRLAPPGAEPEPDVVLLQLRHVADRISGSRRDCFDDRRDRLGRLGGEHEPQVQRMFALVVVRHLVEAVDLRRDRIEPCRGDGHGGEGHRSAEALGVEHRPEAGEHPVREQAAQPPDESGLPDPQRLGRRRERALAHRDAVLQRIDDGVVEIIHEPRPPPPWTCSPRHSARRAGGTGGG